LYDDKSAGEQDRHGQEIELRLVARRVRGSHECFSRNEYRTTSSHILTQRSLVDVQFCIDVLPQVTSHPDGGDLRRGAE